MSRCVPTYTIQSTYRPGHHHNAAQLASLIHLVISSQINPAVALRSFAPLAWMHASLSEQKDSTCIFVSVTAIIFVAF